MIKQLQFLPLSDDSKNTIEAMARAKKTVAERAELFDHIRKIWGPVGIDYFEMHEPTN